MTNVISEHARERIWSRLRMRGSSVTRLVALAVSLGLTSAEATGKLAKYMLNKEKGRPAGSDRVWAGFYFLFSTDQPGAKLVTVFNIPLDLKRLAAEQLKAKKNEKGKN